jgi:hypothetical protein
MPSFAKNPQNCTKEPLKYLNMKVFLLVLEEVRSETGYHTYQYEKLCTSDAAVDCMHK